MAISNFRPCYNDANISGGRNMPYSQYQPFDVLLNALKISILLCLIDVPDLQAGSGAKTSDIPDLSGVWAHASCLPSTKCPFGDLPLTEEGINARAAFDERKSPKYDCIPAGVPAVIFDPYLAKIEQQQDRVIISYEKDDIVRTIWLDGRPHPENFQPSLHGHSIGRYEGNALVVDTANFSFDYIGIEEYQGVPSSTQKHVIERYSRNGDMLHTEVTMADPVYLTRPIKALKKWKYSPHLQLYEYDCDPEAARRILKNIEQSEKLE